MDLKDLFEILPDIILYVTTGYLFILVFNFISLRKKMGGYKWYILCFFGYRICYKSNLMYFKNKI